MRDFAVRLKEERELNKYTQKQMAEFLNIPLRTYKSYEALGVNHREPDQELLLRMAEILETTVDYLLGKVDN